MSLFCNLSPETAWSNAGNSFVHIAPWQPTTERPCVPSCYRIYVEGSTLLPEKFPREFPDLPFQFARNLCTIHKRPLEGCDSLFTRNFYLERTLFSSKSVPNVLPKKYPLHLPISPSIPLPMTCRPTPPISGECPDPYLSLAPGQWPRKPCSDFLASTLNSRFD